MLNFRFLIFISFFSLGYVGPVFGSQQPPSCANVTGDLPEAASAFRHFFESVEHALPEREIQLKIVQLALLARQNVLLLGSSDSASREIADMTLGRVTGEPEVTPYYIQHFHPSISATDIQSAQVPALSFVFWDDIFHLPASILRTLGDSAGFRNARRPWTVLATSSTPLTQLAQFVQTSRAHRDFFDRFSFVAYVPPELQLASSYRDLVHRGPLDMVSLPELTSAQLAQLHSVVQTVQVPIYIVDLLAQLHYHLDPLSEQLVREGLRDSGSQMSRLAAAPESLAQAGLILRAVVVEDWIRSPSRRLVATLSDVKQLLPFFSVAGSRASEGSVPDVEQAPSDSAIVAAIHTQASQKFNAILDEFAGIVHSSNLLPLEQRVLLYHDADESSRLQMSESLFEEMKAIEAQMAPAARAISPNISEETPREAAVRALYHTVRGWRNELFVNQPSMPQVAPASASMVELLPAAESPTEGVPVPAPKPVPAPEPVRSLDPSLALSDALRKFLQQERTSKVEPSAPEQEGLRPKAQVLHLLRPTYRPNDQRISPRQPLGRPLGARSMRDVFESTFASGDHDEPHLDKDSPSPLRLPGASDTDEK